MTQTKHTPAPWTFVPMCNEEFIIRPENKVGEEYKRQPTIATLNGLELGESTESEANARLIAAAPELLEALKDATEVLSIAGYAIVKYEAIMSKAEGK